MILSNFYIKLVNLKKSITKRNTNPEKIKIKKQVDILNNRQY